ncbi:hypothetical protein TNCV_857121 [Trichonephila clavipes]|nr:hypothetical protein TNCV_857121 [Trichonephila clavipes]
MSVGNWDPNARVQFVTQAAVVLKKEPASKPVETARVPDSQTVLYPSENERIRVEEKVYKRAELAETESSYEYIESSNITVNEKGPLTPLRKETDKNGINKHTCENISTPTVDSAPVTDQKENDSSYNGQESIPAKETVIPTSWNENSGKNTSAVSSKIQEKGNWDPNARVQFATQAAVVLKKEPASKPVETARVPDSPTVLYPSEDERIRVEEKVYIELVERAELAETESSYEYIESSNITVNEKGPLTPLRKETDKNGINKHTCENISTPTVDSAPVTDQKGLV